MSKKALILLAEGFEEIEALTAIDILRRADIEVIVCGISGETVAGAHGVKVIADERLDKFSGDVDAVVLPGGMPGAANLANSKAVRELIQRMCKTDRLIAAICASPALVLAPTGVLDGKRATAYPGMEKDFNRDTTFVEDKVVVDKNIITSRSPGTALLFSLAIVEKLVGKEISEKLKAKTLTPF